MYHAHVRRNDERWIVDRVAQTVTTNCAANPAPGDHPAGTRTFYDGATSLSAAPDRGLPTTVEQLAGFPVARRSGR